jgi:hypothetical protein
VDVAIVAAELDRTPSLAEGLESNWYVAGGAGARYQFASDLESFLASPGVAGTAMADEMREELALPDGGLHALPDVGGLAQRVRAFLGLRSERVVGHQQFELPLVEYEMWLPAVDGATGSASSGGGVTSTGSLSFKIFGVGGGPAFEQSVTVELSRTDVPRSERLELVLTGTAEQVEVSRAGRVEARYLRLATLSDVPVHRFVALTPDLAPPPGGGEETIFRMVLRPGDGPATFTLKLAQSRSRSMSTAPKLDTLGAEIGVSYQHKASQSFAFDFRLPDGYEYTAAERLDRPAITWVTGPVEVP